MEDLSQLGVKALDPHTLEIRLKAPTPYFLQQLTHHTGLPLSRANVEQFRQGLHQNPATWSATAPYLLAEWVPQAHIKLTKNPKFP